MLLRLSLKQSAFIDFLEFTGLEVFSQEQFINWDLPDVLEEEEWRGKKRSYRRALLKNSLLKPLVKKRVLYYLGEGFYLINWNALRHVSRVRTSPDRQGRTHRFFNPTWQVSEEDLLYFAGSRPSHLLTEEAELEQFINELPD